MISVFKVDELQTLLQDFYQITKMRIVVFDSELNELVSYPKNVGSFCTLIRETKIGRTACAKCDRVACAEAAKQNKTYIYRCHAGLTEAVAPLYIGRVLVGYLLFGQIFSYNSQEEGWDIISESCQNYAVDFTKLKSACEKCLHVSDEYIKSAARILHATASYLVLERMATLQENSDAAKLNAYLSEHYTEPITSENLCRKLHINRSKLYNLSNQLYGCGIAQHIKNLRMDHAKHLLTDCPEMSIEEIAAACGYTDYNYFITVFSHSTGESPNAFRKKHN